MNLDSHTTRRTLTAINMHFFPRTVLDWTANIVNIVH